MKTMALDRRDRLLHAGARGRLRIVEQPHQRLDHHSDDQREAGERLKLEAETLSADTTPKFASPSPSAPVQSGVVQIAYRNIAIAPDTVRVKVGSTIRWTNYDSDAAERHQRGRPAEVRVEELRRRRHVRGQVEKPG